MREMIIRTFKILALTVQNIFQDIYSHFYLKLFFTHNLVLIFLSLFHLQYISRANDTLSPVTGRDDTVFILCPLLGALLDYAVMTQINQTATFQSSFLM